MARISTVVIVIALLLVGSFSVLAENNSKLSEQDILAHLAPELEAKCFTYHRENNDSKDSADVAGIVVYLQRAFAYQGKNYIAMMAGCGGYGQFLLCEIGDSNKYLASDVIKLPAGPFFPIKFEDINNDGIAELSFLHASVAMGTQMVIFSVMDDKLTPLTYGTDSLFFITNGNIELVDLDENNIKEIILTALVWPPDSTREGEKTIYKWDGKKYQRQK